MWALREVLGFLLDIVRLPYVLLRRQPPAAWDAARLAGAASGGNDLALHLADGRVIRPREVTRLTLTEYERHDVPTTWWHLQLEWAGQRGECLEEVRPGQPVALEPFVRAVEAGPVVVVRSNAFVPTSSVLGDVVAVLVWLAVFAGLALLLF